MRIHIPKHFERFEIITQLKELLTEYAKGGVTNDGVDSFESYFYQSSLDPVKKFLMLCISEDRLGDADYDSVINYYTSKAFSFRGTLKIFEFLDEIKDILGVKIKSYSYTVTSLEVEFEEVKTFDMNLFTSSVSGFFQALLYYQEYLDIIDFLRLDLVSNINIVLSGGLISYNKYKIEEVLTDED
jgi:hypothetical protein